MMVLIVTMHYITNVEITFLASFCLTNAKVRFLAFLLRDGVLNWWSEVFQGLKPCVVESMTWEHFFTIFKTESMPAIEV